jgi:hypothetical protein
MEEEEKRKGRKEGAYLAEYAPEMNCWCECEIRPGDVAMARKVGGAAKDPKLLHLLMI